ncbi:MAG: hypothetical protein JNK04_25530, partial [Myxococcales bacterium]|nr:hypothetical protein [Myxococcales bacterium]
MSGPSFFRPAPLGTLAVILAILGCSVSEGSDGTDDITGGGFGFGGTSSGGGISEPPPGGSGPGSFDYSQLCGLEAADCVPSALDPSCTPVAQGGPVGGGPSAGGAAAGGAGGEAEGGSSSGTGGSAPAYGCQITTTDGNEPAATCDVTGFANVGAVCNASTDCSPGLGCVLSSTGNNEGGGAAAPPVGLCRPYCCGDLEDCPPETFCAPLPLFDAARELEDPSTAIPIPVCTPIIDCQLLGDSCGEGQTCSIVRTNGDTSCVPVGDGGLCSPCPCA